MDFDDFNRDARIVLQSNRDALGGVDAVAEFFVFFALDFRVFSVVA